MLELLAAFASGSIATAIGIYYGEWLRDRRTRRRQGAQFLASLRVLLDDASTTPLTLLMDEERNQRQVDWLWKRWRQHREAFLEFGFLGSADVRKKTQSAATGVALTIQALRNTLDAPESATRAQQRKRAEEFREQAREEVDRLEEALTRPWWKTLRGLSMVRFVLRG